MFYFYIYIDDDFIYQIEFFIYFFNDRLNIKLFRRLNFSLIDSCKQRKKREREKITTLLSWREQI